MRGRFGSKKRGWALSIILSAAVLAGVVMALVSGVGGISSQSEEEAQRALERAIARASVQCYAIEGRYPQSVEYLEKRYHVYIDWDRFTVFYFGFASNIMPDITVVSN